MQREAQNRTVASSERRSIAQTLSPLSAAPALIRESLGPFVSGDSPGTIPRVTFRGPNSDDPIRIGIFAAIHGDEPAGALALVQFLLELTQTPEAAEGYLICAYPVCNPTGFEEDTRASRRGRDLNREFWKNSSEPEVQIIERELKSEHFHGLIQLHADDTSDGIYGFVRGATLSENLLKPALLEAGRILPRNVNALIDGFAAKDGIIFDAYDGILAAPAQVEPVPFEIILETPHGAPMNLQVAALVCAMKIILQEYRRLIAFAANL